MTNYKKKILGVGTGLCRNLTCLGNLSSVKYIFVGVAKIFFMGLNILKAAICFLRDSICSLSLI